MPVVVAPPSVTEQPFQFVRDGLTLDGTLTTPRAASGGPLPIVLIVAGSGPTDRNANGPLLSTNAYALLAWGLAEHGIASVRYDKRGIGKSAGNGGDPTRLSIADYVADVMTAAEALGADRRFEGVFLLGHSEGAGHVLQAANRGARIAGVALVAGQGRKLAEVLHDQFILQADASTVLKIDSAFARFTRGEEPGEVPSIAQTVIVPVYQHFLQSLAAYDPVYEARKYGGPLLIMQGTTDLQVTMRDAELLSTAQPRATFVRLEGVNHVLKAIASTDVNAQMAVYRDPSLALAPLVVPTIVKWINTARSDRSR